MTVSWSWRPAPARQAAGADRPRAKLAEGIGLALLLAPLITPRRDSDEGFEAGAQLHPLRGRQRAFDAEHPVGVIEEPQPPLLVLAISLPGEAFGVIPMPDLLAQPAKFAGIAQGGRVQKLGLSRRSRRLGQVLQLAGDEERVLERDISLFDGFQGWPQGLQLTSQRDLAVGATGGDVGTGSDPVQCRVLTELVEGLPAIEGGNPTGSLQLEEVYRGTDELELGAKLVGSQSVDIDPFKRLQHGIAMLDSRRAWNAPPTPI
jgi:hypothetical protein